MNNLPIINDVRLNERPRNNMKSIPSLHHFPTNRIDGRIPPMPALKQLITKGIHLLHRRLREQGLQTTLLWFYGRGIPAITGVPLLQFCQVTLQVYVGSQFNIRGKQKLKHHGITSVVNMRTEWDDTAHDLGFPQYLHLPTIDDTAPSIPHLEKGIQFIRECVRSGGKVYIHCAGGIGRAPTMAAAYFIAEGNSLDESLAMIRRVRPFINITPPQMDLLHQFAEYCEQFSSQIYEDR
jgi:predicted protein tyrosine phosphatase